MYGKGQRWLNTLPCPFHAADCHSVGRGPLFFRFDSDAAPLNLKMAALTVGAIFETLAALPPAGLETTVRTEPASPPRPNKGPDSGMTPGPFGVCGEGADLHLGSFAADVLAPTLAVPGVRTRALVFHRAPSVVSPLAGLALIFRVDAGHLVTWAAASAA